MALYITEKTQRCPQEAVFCCQTGGHVFDVVIEDVTVLDDYDPHAELGCNVGTMKEFEVIR